MSKEKKRQVHEIRLGRVLATIWETHTNSKVRHNATFSRLCRDADGQWHDLNCFGRDDLPLLVKAADRVHTWIYEQSNRSAQQKDEQLVDF